jgi:hypothetical protein
LYLWGIELLRMRHPRIAQLLELHCLWKVVALEPVRQLSWEPAFLAQGLAPLRLRLVRAGSAVAWEQWLLA